MDDDPRTHDSIQDGGEDDMKIRTPPTIDIPGNGTQHSDGTSATHTCPATGWTVAPYNNQEGQYDNI